MEEPLSDLMENKMGNFPWSTTLNFTIRELSMTSPAYRGTFSSVSQVRESVGLARKVRRMVSEQIASSGVALDSVCDPSSGLSCDTHGQCDWHSSSNGQGLRRTRDDGVTDNMT